MIAPSQYSRNPRCSTARRLDGRKSIKNPQAGQIHLSDRGRSILPNLSNLSDSGCSTASRQFFCHSTSSSSNSLRPYLSAIALAFSVTWRSTSDRLSRTMRRGIGNWNFRHNQDGVSQTRKRTTSSRNFRHRSLMSMYFIPCQGQRLCDASRFEHASSLSIIE
jgi:hypothetical protein